MCNVLVAIAQAGLISGHLAALPIPVSVWSSWVSNVHTIAFQYPQLCAPDTSATFLTDMSKGILLVLISLLILILVAITITDEKPSKT